MSCQVMGINSAKLFLSKEITKYNCGDKNYHKSLNAYIQNYCLKEKKKATLLSTRILSYFRPNSQSHYQSVASYLPSSTSTATTKRDKQTEKNYNLIKFDFEHDVYSRKKK